MRQTVAGSSVANASNGGTAGENAPPVTKANTTTVRIADRLRKNDMNTP